MAVIADKFKDWNMCLQMKANEDYFNLFVTKEKTLPKRTVHIIAVNLTSVCGQASAVVQS